MKAFGYLTAVVLFVAAVYGLWQLSRTINYNISYADMVEETVCEMVKPEHLKEPEKCQ